MVTVKNLETINPVSVKEIGEDKILQEVDIIKQVLQDYPHFESAGTILGLYRDKHLIPHDSDYDIEILDKGYDYDKLNTILVNNGLRLIRIMHHNNRFMQLAYRMKCGFIFDIYIYYKEHGKWKNYNDYGILVHNKDNLPTSNIEGYLELRYGKDWQTPKSKKESWENDAGLALIRWELL